MKIVVGLGNPGRQYAATRHNVGWMVVERLADRAGWGGGRERDAARVVRGRYHDLDLALVKPLTFMNESGLAVRKVLAREHAPLDELLVVCDDFALPFGRLRLRAAGSAGGHNGLRSIIGELGSQAFARLRVGIGEPGSGAIDHVLSRFEAAERAALAGGHRRGRGCGRGVGPRRGRAGRQPVERVAPARRPPTDAEGAAGAVAPPPPEVAARHVPRRDPPHDDRLAPHPAARPGDHAARARRVTDGSTRLRGRSGRDRRLAEAFESAARHPARGGDRLHPPRRSAGPRRPDRAARRAAARCRRWPPASPARGPDARVGTALRHVTYAGMPHGAKSYVAAAVARATGERLVWIARDAEIADRVVEELEAWFGDAAAVGHARAAIGAGVRAVGPHRRRVRRAGGGARRLGRAARRASSWPASRRSSSAPCRRTTCLAIRCALAVGRRVSQDRLLAELVRLGYEPVVEVGGRGEFVRRGGLVDFFPPGAPLPVRVEWFGDEVESLRAFDPADQRGVAPLQDVTILPASEFLMPPRRSRGVAARAPGACRAGACPSAWPRTWRTSSTAATPGDAAEVWGGVLAPATALDHVGDAIWVLDEPGDVDHAAETLWGQADERAAELVAAGELSRAWPSVYLEPRVWRAAPPRGPHPGAALGERRRRRAARRQPVRLARAVAAAGAPWPARRAVERWRRDGQRVVRDLGPVGPPGRAAGGRRGQRRAGDRARRSARRRAAWPSSSAA